MKVCLVNGVDGTAKAEDNKEVTNFSILTRVLNLVLTVNGSDLVLVAQL